MPVQDRTVEFRACVDSIRSRSALSPKVVEQKQRLLQQRRDPAARSDFSHMANAIGKDISSANLKLGKLAQR